MSKYLTLLLILCFHQVRSQTIVIQENTELNIQTKFSQYGSLLESEKSNSKAISQFNKGQKCLVKRYLGNKKFKIEYKRWVGYVTSDYLVVNNELDAVIKKQEENKDFNRENINNATVDQTNINIETLTKVNEKERLRLATEAKAKADEEKRLRLAVEAKAIEDEKERIRLATEVKAKADEQERARLAAEAKAKADEEERIRLSVETKAKADEKERIRLATEAKAIADEEERIKLSVEAKAIATQTEAINKADKINPHMDKIKQPDFIQKNKELNIQTKFDQYGSLYETSSSNSPVKAQFNKGQKCVVKSYLGKNKFKIEYKNWVGYVTSEYLVLNNELEDIIQKYEEFLIVKIKTDDIEMPQEELNFVQTQEKNDEVEFVESDLKQEGNVEQVKTEEKANQQSVDIKSLELRFTCHYQMNEIDDFYKEKLVKTENYEVNNHLKIELYRIGNKRHVFINFDGNLGCASYFSHNRSYAKIKLENNTVVTIYHSWNVDCANFSLKGILTNSSISKLKESPIKSIKLQGTKDFIQIEEVTYKEFFMDKLECLD